MTLLVIGKITEHFSDVKVEELNKTYYTICSDVDKFEPLEI